MAASQRAFTALLLGAALLAAGGLQGAAAHTVQHHRTPLRRLEEVAARSAAHFAAAVQPRPTDGSAGSASSPASSHHHPHCATTTAAPAPVVRSEQLARSHWLAAAAEAAAGGAAGGRRLTGGELPVVDIPSCGLTECDNPAVLAAYRDLPTTPVRTIQYRVINLGLDDGSHRTLTAEQISQQHDTLNAAYAGTGIQFELTELLVNTSFVRLRTIFVDCNPADVGNGVCNAECAHQMTGNDGGDCDAEQLPCAAALIGDGTCQLQCNKAYHNYDGGDCCDAGVTATEHTCFDPASAQRAYVSAEEFKGMLNIANDDYMNLYFAFWTNRNVLGYATFPWETHYAGPFGGIVLNPTWYGSRTDGDVVVSEGDTLVHESGHALGLWHTFHGVSELDCAHPCFEWQAGADVGDLIADTPPTSINFDCGDPDGQTCGVSWTGTPFTNYMGYGDDVCIDNFTPLQAARMRCYVDRTYAAWTRTTDTPTAVPLAPRVYDAADGSLSLSWPRPLFTARGESTSSLSCEQCSDANGLRMWAAQAAASAGADVAATTGSPCTAALQAAGRPNAPTCRYSCEAWQPAAGSDAPYSLTVTFEQQVTPSELHVYIPAYTAAAGGNATTLDSVVLLLADTSEVPLPAVTLPGCEEMPLVIPLAHLTLAAFLSGVRITTSDAGMAIDAVLHVSADSVQPCNGCTPTRYELERTPAFDGGASTVTIASGQSFTDGTVDAGSSYSYRVRALSPSSTAGAWSLPLTVAPRGGYCGDGTLQADSEACDDGNQEDGDGCAADCSAVEDGWKCEGAAGSGGDDAADSRCFPSCGDGICDAADGCGCHQDCDCTPAGARDQYAVAASASWDSAGCYGAAAAVGRPNAAASCAYSCDAWSPTPEAGSSHWLLLTLEQAAVLHSVRVWETQNAALLLTVAVVDAAGNETVLASGVQVGNCRQPVDIPLAYGSAQSLPLAVAVKLYVGEQAASIDAVRARSFDGLQRLSCGAGSFWDASASACLPAAELTTTSMTAACAALFADLDTLRDESDDCASAVYALTHVLLGPLTSPQQAAVCANGCASRVQAALRALTLAGCYDSPSGFSPDSAPPPTAGDCETTLAPATGACAAEEADFLSRCGASVNRTATNGVCFFGDDLLALPLRWPYACSADCAVAQADMADCYTSNSLYAGLPAAHVEAADAFAAQCSACDAAEAALLTACALDDLPLQAGFPATCTQVCAAATDSLLACYDDTRFWATLSKDDTARYEAFRTQCLAQLRPCTVAFLESDAGAAAAAGCDFAAVAGSGSCTDACQQFYSQLEAQCRSNWRPEERAEAQTAAAAAGCLLDGAVGVWQLGSWSGCTRPCGGGSRTRSVRCVHVPTGNAASNCPGQQPSSSEGCNQQPCEGQTWHAVPSTTTCSAACGGGVLSSLYLCLNSNMQLMAEGACSDVPLPDDDGDDAVACATQACGEYQWVVGAWSDCGDYCTGSRERQVYCAQRAADGQLDVRPDSFCPQPRPLSRQLCDFGCLLYRWQPADWGECSATCGPGVQRRAVPCKDEQGRTQSPSFCIEARPAREQPCQLAACGKYRWDVTPWSACSASCGGGSQTRTVRCVDTALAALAADAGEAEVDALLCRGNSAAPDSSRACNSVPCQSFFWQVRTAFAPESCANCEVQTRTVVCMSTTGVAVSNGNCAPPMPPTELACPCSTCHDSTCSGHGACSGDGQCNCQTGWSGNNCETPLGCPTGIYTAIGDCCDGVVDLRGSCCSQSQLDACGICGGDGLLIDAHGACCSTVVDRDGTCCASGKLDACGVCDGDGVVVDIEGNCCQPAALLDDAGHCCDSGALNECGVCDGGPADCPYSVLMRVYSLTDTGTTVNNMRIAIADVLSLGNVNTDTREWNVYPTPISGASDIGFVVDQDASTAVADVGLLLEQQLADPDSAFRTQSALRDVDTQATTVGRIGTCGNGICEVGERSSDGTGCRDCTVEFRPCQPHDCNGHGICQLTGVCACFAGYSGTACDACPVGTEAIANGGCRSVTLVTSIFAAQPLPPALPSGNDGGDTGDCDNSTTSSPSVVDLFTMENLVGNQNNLIIVGSALGAVLVLMCCCYMCGKRSSSSDDLKYLLGEGGVPPPGSRAAAAAHSRVAPSPPPRGPPVAHHR